jgi:hypothetical protein
VLTNHGAIITSRKEITASNHHYRRVKKRKKKYFGFYFLNALNSIGEK